MKKSSPRVNRRSNPITEFLPEEKLRILLVGLVFLAGFLILAGRLFAVQIQSGEEHREKISRQSIRRIRIPARRGKIYTSDYKLLAGNSASCNLVFYPEEMRFNRRQKSIDYMMEAADALGKAIGRENPLSADSINRHLNTRPGLPLTVFTRLTPRETARALEVSRSYRGVDIEADETRIYPEGKLAAHLVGYTRFESPRQAPDRSDFFYYVPDLVGRAGIEAAFDRLPGTGQGGAGRVAGSAARSARPARLFAGSGGSPRLHPPDPDRQNRTAPRQQCDPDAGFESTGDRRIGTRRAARRIRASRRRQRRCARRRLQPLL